MNEISGNNSQQAVEESVNRLATLMGELAEKQAEITEYKRDLKNEGFDVASILRCAKIKSRNEEKKTKEQLQLFFTYAAASGLDIEP